MVCVLRIGVFYLLMMVNTTREKKRRSSMCIYSVCSGGLKQWHSKMDLVSVLINHLHNRIMVIVFFILEIFNSFHDAGILCILSSKMKLIKVSLFA